jgi:transposase
VLDVEQWAELRQERFVRGVPIKELVRRTGLSRNTIRAALRSDRPPKFRCPERSSKLDPFKDEIHRLLKDDPRLTGVRVRELIEPLGFDGGKTVVDDYLREIRPVFLKPRTHQRTVYRPGEICQWDLWETSAPVPVGHGQLRRGWVVVACLGYSRAGAGALVFSKEAPDVLWGMTRCLWSLGALPELIVWDREGCLHAGGGRPTADYAAFCGQLPVDWHFCEPADPQAKGAVERLQGYMETNFEPGRARFPLVAAWNEFAFTELAASGAGATWSAFGLAFVRAGTAACSHRADSSSSAWWLNPSRGCHLFRPR